jgi:hypothetical protein
MLLYMWMYLFIYNFFLIIAYNKFFLWYMSSIHMSKTQTSSENKDEINASSSSGGSGNCTLAIKLTSLS